MSIPFFPVGNRTIGHYIRINRILAEFWRISGRNTEFPDGLAALHW
jgi:hypothetical protein